MSDISEQIDALITARRERLPAVRAEIAGWQRVDAAVVALAEAVAALRQDPATPPSVAAQLAQLRIADARPTVSAAVEPLQRVERRFGRDRLCVGVGGVGGSGKTTVVQSLSGLTDASLATGGSGPVTAVRTRVVHSPGRLRVVLEPHTVETFRAAHLEPWHIAAGLAGPPADVEALRSAAYPAGPAPAGRTGSPIRRLSEIQAALWSYEGLLDRQGRPLELIGDQLDRLREYVTHPADGDGADAQPVAHRYLAVREARIECAFPRVDVGAIEFVDLPGLGGVAGTDRHHVAGLRHDVDVVLLVTRQVRGDASDDAALAVLDEARGFVSRRTDFVLVVLNVPGDPAPPTGHQGGAASGGRSALRVLTVDGRNPDDVSARLVRPLLRHLTERLSTMDREVHAGARASTGVARDALIDLAVATKVLLRQACDATAGTGDLYARTDELTAVLTTALRGALARVRQRAGEGDADVVTEARRIHRELVTWIRDGLGVGYEQWCAAARRRLVRDPSAGRFVRTELDRVRTELDRRYQALDSLLGLRLEEAWTDVAGAVTCAMRPLLGDRRGAAALTRLDELAAASARPCPVLRAAVADLLALRLDYRTHLGPRVRPAFESLAVDGSVPGEPVVEDLYRAVIERAERAASRVVARLLDEAALPGWILVTSVERFVDAVVDTGAVERELQNLSRSYRHALWPGLFPGLDRDDAAVTRATRAADDLLAATAELEHRAALHP